MIDRRQLSLAAYRSRNQTDEALRTFFAEEMSALRERGHITARPVPVCRTESGRYLVVLEWRSPVSVDEAHADPVITELWARKAMLVEYVGVGDLERSGVPFASCDVIGDV